MEHEKQPLLEKYCKLKMKNGFLLDGTVKEINQYGIMFETEQKTSFIAWSNIGELVPMED